MNRFVIIIICLFLSLNLVYSSDTSEVKTAKEKARAKLQKLPADSLKKIHPPKQQVKSESKQKAIEQYNKKQDKPLKKKDKAMSDALPSDITVPAEFDETQAVLISWPSYAFDEDGNWLEALLPGKGLYWVNDSTYYVKDIAGYIIDLFDESQYPEVWGTLTNAIQQECAVWIRLSDPADTTDLKTWMSNRGTPLTNYRFFHDPDGENAFWMRDFGPYSFYFGDEDSLALVDMTYYPDRPIDNAFPTFLAEQLNIPVYHSDVETEGGNYMNDSWGRNFYSNVIYSGNEDDTGPIYIDDTGAIVYSYRQPMTKSEVDSEMNKFLPAENTTILPQLWCDGGTGHIDLYLKLVDDETILTPNFPSVFNNTGFYDYNIIKNNQNTISKLNSTYDRNYRILKMPVPTSDNGTYDATDCYGFYLDARNYINGLIVNKSFIVPIYSNDESGNKDGDEEAIALLKSYMPGYKIVGIDARLLSPMGGAIHCITMQIPAENPIRIWHPSITGQQEFESEYKITAKIYNKSGISSAVCKWKKNYNGDWNTINLSETDELFSNIISSANFTYSDTIHYYLEVTSNNGKTMRKPIVAPDGYYTFYFNDPNSVENIENEKYTLYLPQPNPSISSTNIKFNLPDDSHVKISIYNLFGNEIETVLNDKVAQGCYSISFNTEGLSQGVYFIRMITGNGIMQTLKIIVE